MVGGPEVFAENIAAGDVEEDREQRRKHNDTIYSLETFSGLLATARLSTSFNPFFL